MIALYLLPSIGVAARNDIPSSKESLMLKSSGCAILVDAFGDQVVARVHPAMGRRLGSTPSAGVLVRETPDRLGGSLSIVSCCLKARRVDRTYVATI